MIRIATPLLILVESGLLWMLGYQPVIPLLAAILALVWLVRPIFFDFPKWTKFAIPLGLISYFLVRIYFVPELSFRNDWVFPVWFTVSLGECFLIAQLFELCKRRKTNAGMMDLCLLGMATLACVCCRFAIGTERNIIFFGIIVAVSLLCVIFQYSSRPAKDAYRLPRGRWYFGSLMILSTTMFVGFSSWYTSGVLQSNIEWFQEWWMKNLAQQISGFSGTEIGYTSNATLNNITELKKTNPQKPVLRIYSDHPPGYLRGRVFHHFHGRDWNGRANRTRIKPMTAIPEFYSGEDPLFQLRPAEIEGDFIEIRIENLDTSFAFLPLDASFFAAKPKGSQSQLKVDSDLVVRSINTSGSYSSFVGRNPIAQSFSIQGSSEYLSRPNMNRTAFRQIEQIALDVTRNDTTDQQRILSIEKYFRDNYEYSLEQKNFPLREKLPYFILNKPAAHCEFFASAAVTFLRINGIPSRYVTGFATDEFSNEEEYYIARNRHAHAWAEAYDRNQKRWVIVEATPGVDLPKSPWPDGVDADSRMASGSGSQRYDSDESAFWRFFREIWMYLRGFFDEVGRRIRGPLNILFASMIVFGLGYRYWVNRRQYQDRTSWYGRLELQRMSLERRLARRKIKRRKNETNRQFQRRIDAECQEKLGSDLDSVRDWFSKYENCRFGPESSGDVPPSPRI